MKISFLSLASVFLVIGPSAWAQSAPAPSVTKMQSSCFATFTKFADQASCIHKAINSVAGIEADPFVQEYVLFLQNVEVKVAKDRLEPEGARLALMQQLNKLRQEQSALIASQAQQTIHEIPPYQASKLEVHKVKPLPRPITTNCSVIGDHTHCTTQQQ